MASHIVSSFSDELKQIDRMIGDMGELAGAMLERATQALIAADTAAAGRVVSDDAIMDARQRELDERAIGVIARRQPMARDLRLLVSAIRMGAELERIGDLAKNIAKRVGAVGQDAMPGDLSAGLGEMAALALGQLRTVVGLYAARQHEKLAALRARDESIDMLYTTLFRDLLACMAADSRNVTPCTHLLFCAKNLERIGDHVTNIAENAYYVLAGSQLPPDRPKGDETARARVEGEGGPL